MKRSMQYGLLSLALGGVAIIITVAVAILPIPWQTSEFFTLLFGMALIAFGIVATKCGEPQPAQFPFPSKKQFFPALMALTVAYLIVANLFDVPMATIWTLFVTTLAWGLWGALGAVIAYRKHRRQTDG